ncbi:MAG TPA: hypothetical protein VNL71_15965 [Chloroflexota bacterium]|nr:hypothetical protein [Chloroflexota bacterium]
MGEERGVGAVILVAALGVWRGLPRRMDSATSDDVVFRRFPGELPALRQELMAERPGWLLLGGGMRERELYDRMNLAGRIVPEIRIVVLDSAENAARVER